MLQLKLNLWAEFNPKDSYMIMFTSKEQKNLVKLLKTTSNQDEVMTLEELHGFLYGLAIIPEMLVPSQWLPSIFGGEEMCEIGDEKEGEQLLGSLFSAYNRINVENKDGKLVFPFDIKKGDADTVTRIRKWSHGLFVALSKSKKILQKYGKSGDTGKEAHESFAVSYCILRAVAFPDRIPEFLERIQKGVKSDVSHVLSDANFLSMLPEAVASIHQYSKVVQKALSHAESKITTVTPTTQLQVTKIGRNDPCHCGSGIKFKKCCGK